MGVYEELGVRKVINCLGEGTIIGGSRVDPSVMEAMAEAARSFCHLTELNDRAGEVIAEITGAEAGMVTSGAASSMMMAAAACMMRGTDLEEVDIHFDMENYPYEHDEWQRLMWRLPDTEGLRHEFVAQRCHRNPYLYDFRIPGGRLVWVCGEGGCSAEEIEDAINERTAAVVHLYQYDERGLGAPLEEVLEAAHGHGVPVIVDDASGCPPRSKLTLFPRMGVDLACVSGGKAIKGPNDTGLLFGRRDLIRLARLQYSPHRGVGRPCKVDRTQVIGLVTALRLYVDQDEGEEFRRWDAKVRRLMDALRDAPNVRRAERVVDHASPNVKLTIDEEGLGMTAKEVHRELMRGDPRVVCGPMDWDTEGVVLICVRELADDEEEVVVERLREVLSR